MKLPTGLAIDLIGLFSSLTAPAGLETKQVSNTTHPWLDTFRPHSERIRLLQANLTLDEKLQFIEGAAALENHGVGAAINPCIGLIKTPHRLGIPNLCMGDGPSGVSNGLGNVTTFPAPIVVASSWNPDLMYDYAKAIAQEHRDKGHNVALTPTMNIQRAPLWGRNAESLSEDQFLTAKLAVANVKGTQSEHVLASAKHFAAYNQETNRFGHAPLWSATNVSVSNRTLQEVYFPAFKAVVEQANPGSIMTSYNKVNGKHASENYAILSDLFSWGFDNGFTVTDWYFGQRSTVDAALAGQTMSMPGGKSDFGFEDFYSKHAVKEVLRNGSLPIEVLDDMVRRVITPMFEHGLMDDGRLGNVMDDVRSQAHHDLSVNVVEEGSILLKNEQKALPLGPDVKKIAVIGAGGNYGALVTERYGGFVGSPNLNETLVTPLQGIKAKVGEAAEVVFAQGHPQIGNFESITDSAFKGGLNVTVFSTPDWKERPIVYQVMNNVTAALKLDLGRSLPEGVSAIFEGVLDPPETGIYQFSLYAGGFAKLYIDGNEIVWLRKEDFVNYATGEIALRAGSEVSFRLEYSSAPAITSVGLDLGWVIPSVRRALLLEAVEAADYSDVAIVFVGNVLSEGGDGTSLALSGAYDELVTEIAKKNRRVVVVAQTNNPFLMPWLDEVQAVLVQWYAGEGVGTALANILFGDVNASGKLAMTFPASDSDGPTATQAAFPGPDGDLMSDNADVYYSEGLHVGYKWFDHHDVKPLFPFGHGLSYTTFELRKIGVELDAKLRLHIETSVTNTGDRDGQEVVQLYIGYPREALEPPKLLRGFEKVLVRARETTAVAFTLDARKDLQHWSEDRGAWALASGRYTLYIGTSSRDIAWSETVHIAA